MDAKLSCLTKGMIGVIFGLLALLLPKEILATFYALFWVLIGGGIAILFVLAITSKSEESLFWFGLSAVLLVIGAISFFAPGFVAIIFVIIIAGVAFYSGFSGITVACTQPRTKYFLIPGMFIAATILLLALIWFFPTISKNIILTLLGTFALVFGLSSILMGWYLPAESIPSLPEEAPVKKGECSCPKPEEK